MRLLLRLLLAISNPTLRILSLSLSRSARSGCGCVPDPVRVWSRESSEFLRCQNTENKWADMDDMENELEWWNVGKLLVLCAHESFKIAPVRSHIHTHKHARIKHTHSQSHSHSQTPHSIESMRGGARHTRAKITIQSA